MHLRSIVPVGAVCAILSNWRSALVLVLVLALLTVTVTCFLRWFVNLSVARRADVLRLIKALRGR